MTATPVSVSPDAFGFEIVRVSVEVPPVVIVEGAKDLVIVGAASTVRVADGVLPVPPLEEETAPDVLFLVLRSWRQHFHGGGAGAAGRDSAAAEGKGRGIGGRSPCWRTAAAVGCCWCRGHLNAAWQVVRKGNAGLRRRRAWIGDRESQRRGATDRNRGRSEGLGVWRAGQGRSWLVSSRCSCR